MPKGLAPATLDPVKVDLVSSHSPVAAAQRLKAAVGDTLTPDTSKRVTGNGTETQIVLWVHRPRFRNDFKVMLTATMAAQPGGARIRGRLGAPLFPRLFMGCWFTFVMLFLVFGAGVFVLGSGASRWAGLPFIGIPVLMLLIGGALLGFAGMHAREDRALILAFLRDTIGTRDHRGRDI